MATSKSVTVTKAKDTPAPKKAAPKATTVVKAAPAPKVTAAPKVTPAPKVTATPKAAPKKVAAKKPAAPKLTDPQSDLLKKVAAHADPTGYHAEKKPENKTLEALLKHKLVKKGKKNSTSGNYHYMVSTAGKKHLETPVVKS
jgi:hypothetical protein